MKTKTQFLGAGVLLLATTIHCWSATVSVGSSGGGGGTSTAITTTTVQPETGLPVYHTAVQNFKADDGQAVAWIGQNQKQTTWLGLATEESSEALTSQLRLDPGVGLTVTYVATNSPAEKAGLRKNDVLVEFNGQPLVHPEQLRKLVHVREEGDSIKLGYYRAGKKESASVTLSKTTERNGIFGSGSNWDEAMDRYRKTLDQFRYQSGDAFQKQMKDLQQSLKHITIDRDQVQKEIQHSMESARKAAADALRQANDNNNKFGSTGKALEELARGQMKISKDATVMVNSSDHSVQTKVKADDSGTYVIVADPQKHLTVHDKSGKLLFDGTIESSEEQAKVPTEIWEKVKPMLDGMGSESNKDPESE